MKRLNIKSSVLAILLLCGALPVSAYINGPSGRPVSPGNNPSTLRAVCNAASSQVDLSVNNVRARLLNGGDMWWNLKDGSYLIPKPAPGALYRPSSMFAGAVWIGGYDSGNQLKIAAQTYRQGGNDYWPGPLDPQTGSVTQVTCDNWDKHFQVSGANIDLMKSKAYQGDVFINNFDRAIISDDIKKWPGRGNPFFNTFYTFNLPNQDLAPFFDRTGDGVYDPNDGDFPIIEISNCGAGTASKAQYGDDMVWWIYNDQGNGAQHGETKGRTIRMEVQAQAFAFKADNQINDMSFYRFKLLNRAKDQLDRTYISMWSDPDLGCYNDDYIGCQNDVVGIKNGKPVYRNLGYVYNGKTPDDLVCTSPGGSVDGYGNNIPILGSDYFRGPKDENGNEIDMSSFTYYMNNTPPAPPPPQSNPQLDIEYYGYMTGFWRDGTPFRDNCALGYYDPSGTAPPTKFVYPDAPSVPNGCSMAAQNATYRDLRFLQSSGPFKLLPGASNEVIIGLPWVADQVYPRPVLNDLIAADDIAQALFDNCFDLLDGPDAPSLDVIEMNKSLVINILPIGNNLKVANGKEIGEAYNEVDPSISPALTTNTAYKFEGYRLYQVLSEDVTVQDLDNTDKAKQILQVDLKNNIQTMYNWEQNPDLPSTLIARKKVTGANKGIQHTVEFTKDQFSAGSGTTGELINHKKYYFLAVAYAQNNWKKFNDTTRTGQATTYLIGRRSQPVSVGIPRRTLAETGGSVLNSKYGDIPQITRLDGKGNGGLFVDLEDYKLDSFNITQANNAKGALTYKKGFGPVEIKVIDPRSVPKGNFILSVGRDSTGSVNTVPVAWTPQTALAADTAIYERIPPFVNSNSYWELKNADRPTVRWVSNKLIKDNTDQVIPDLGISVRVTQVDDAGANLEDPTNGFISSTVDAKDPEKAWFSAVLDEDSRFPFAADALNFIRNGTETEDDYIKDKAKAFNKPAGGFVPFTLCNCRERESGGAGANYQPYITPSWLSGNQSSHCVPNGPYPYVGSPLQIMGRNKLEYLNNVDIVFTPDTTMWSRCIVVETTNKPWADQAGLVVQGGKTHMDIREHASVNKRGEDETGRGMGWFPGYAVDVETGQRLNVFFGEASGYDGSTFPDGTAGSASTGGDMIFNPTTSVLVGDLPPSSPGQFALGAMHMVYVTRAPYDGCAKYKKVALGQTGTANTIISANRRKVLSEVTWASIVLPTRDIWVPKAGSTTNFELKIPTETKIKMRVNNKYEVLKGTAVNNGFPQYQFSLDNLSAGRVTEDTRVDALSEINVVPNPYYAHSDYEISDNDFVVKITNLPLECTITIYSLDGKLIRTYPRKEIPTARTQAAASVDWDMKNAKGIPVSSGVYLIHVNAPGVGERVIKWFGVTRAIDAQRL